MNDDKLTINDILKGCTCGVIELAGESMTIRCVTCPIHGDMQFRKNMKGEGNG